MEKIIYFFRHGQTDWNLKRRFQGHSNVALNDFGMEQAARLAEYLKTKKLDIIFSSDLDRALQTAKIVAQDKDIPVKITEILREAHMGDVEGMYVEDAKNKFGSDIIRNWKSNEAKYLDMALPGGETKRAMINRVNTFIHSQLIEDAHSHIGISTHGGVIHKMVSFLMGVDILEYPVTNCSLFTFSKNKENYQLVDYQDFSQ